MKTKYAASKKQLFAFSGSLIVLKTFFGEINNIKKELCFSRETHWTMEKVEPHFTRQPKLVRLQLDGEYGKLSYAKGIQNFSAL